MPAFFTGRTTRSCSLHSSVGMLVIVIADSPVKELVGQNVGASMFPNCGGRTSVHSSRHLVIPPIPILSDRWR